MKSRPVSDYFLVFGALLALPGCHPPAVSTPVVSVACRVEGPPELLPAPVSEVRTGMTRAQLQRVLGNADYSPADGVFYFSTGGDCPLGEVAEDNHSDGVEPRPAPSASCGVVADFNDQDGKLQRQLHHCWWGAIAE